MKKYYKHFLTGLILFLSNSIICQELIVDSLFSTNGYNLMPTIGHFRLLNLFTLPDETYLVCGNEHSSSPAPAFHQPVNRVIKFDQCGNIDSTYGINGLFVSDNQFYNGEIEAKDYFVYEDGSLLIAGSAIKEINNTIYRSQSLVKVNSFGFLDSTFILNDFTMFSDTSSPSIISASFSFTEEINDEKIFCVGDYESYTEKGIIFSRFNSNGTPDSSFYDYGYTLIPIDSGEFQLTNAYRVENNKILILGFYNNLELVTLKFNNEGIRDSTYGLNGTVISSTLIDLYRHSNISNGKLIIISNQWNNESTSEQYFIERFLTNGLPDTSFGINGIRYLDPIANTECIGFDVVENDKYLIGFISQQGNISEGKTYLLRNNGELEPTFCDNGVLISILNNNQTAYNKALILQDGRWILSGANNVDRGCIISRHTISSLTPNITFNGSVLSSGVNSPSVINQWYYNGIEIQNEMNSICAFQGVGTYVVTITDTAYCGTESDTLIINTLKNNIISDRTNLITPNPTQNTFSVKGDFLNENYVITDLTGRIVQTGEVINENQLINCMNLKPGVYNLIFHSGWHSKITVVR